MWAPICRFASRLTQILELFVSDRFMSVRKLY